MPQLFFGDTAFSQVPPKKTDGINPAGQRHKSSESYDQRAQSIGLQKSIQSGDPARASAPDLAPDIQPNADRKEGDDRESGQVKSFPPDASSNHQAKQSCEQWDHEQERQHHNITS